MEPLALADCMKALAKYILEQTTPRLLYEHQLRKKRNSEPEIGLLPKLCKRDAISLDIGANIGLYSYYMLPYSAAVLAFEPLPTMQERLWTLFGGRITVHAVALSNEDGKCEIRFPRGNTSWATIDPENSLLLAGDMPLESVMVPTRRLDSYELDDIGFIKIDVEGHEESVLRGALQTIQRNRPTLLIEIEERHNPGSIARVVDMLEQLGYRGSFMADGTRHPVQDFDSGRDQPIGNVGKSGKLGRYINNFIFEPN